MKISINVIAILAVLAMASAGVFAAAPQSTGDKIENGAKTKTPSSTPAKHSE